MKRAVNFVLFQACWFAAVVGVARNWTWQAPVFVAACVAIHLAWVSENARRDALVVVVVSLLAVGVKIVVA